MKKSFRFLVLISISFLFQFKMYGQSLVKHDTLRKYKTDIFVLHACSPDQLSFQRFGDGHNQNIQVPVRKLSINSNRFSAFRVDQINPLRFSFYINSETVTKFVDTDDNVISNFKKDTMDIQASSIEILDIFHSDSLNAKQADASSIKDSIATLQSEFEELNGKYAQTFYFLLDRIKEKDLSGPGLTPKDPKIPNIKRMLDSAKNKFDTILIQFEIVKKKIVKQTGNYTFYLSSLVINNNVEDIIKDIMSNSLDTIGFTNVLKKTSLRLNVQADSTLDHIGVVNNTLNLLQRLDAPLTPNSTSQKDTSFYNELEQKIDTLSTFAFNKSFSISRSVLFSNGTDGELERQKTFEFVTSEKLNQVNYFVLYSSLQIGKLLQTVYTENSRLVNKLNYQNCISANDKDSIKLHLKLDVQIYEYMQNISSNLNVLIKYAQLNNPVFNSTIKGINEDYKTFLKYVKILDFLNDNNTNQFTLPFSTNLRNVDIIRYSVNKRDRISGREENYTYDLWLKGGLKVDFSVAILMSGLNDYSYNKDALFKVSDTANSSGIFESTQRTDSFLIKRQNTGKYNFAFGGMVNVMLRSGASWITPGASIGIAYSSATTNKLQFIGALSLQFGKSERIIAHFGVVAGEAQRLDLSQLSYNPKKDVLDKGNTYKVKGDFSSATIPPAFNFMFKPFFGISYSLSKKNALNAVGSNADNYSNSFP